MPRQVEVFVKRIEMALRSEQAVKMQRLAEAVARIKWPERFSDRQFSIQGRNNEEQTRKGWPDALSADANGRLHAVEATRDKGTWFGHIDRDLAKLALRKDIRLASYFFVGGYPDHEPTIEELKAYRKRFKRFGVAEKDVAILVGQDLAEELSQPQYSQICQTILGISIVPSAFRVLQPGQLWDQALASFQPTVEDFRRHIVWEPPLVAEVVATLAENGRAVLIRGHGASGKTTFAQLLSQKMSLGVFYYLDLADASYDGIDVGAALSDMIEFGGKNVTFVIDNIHLEHDTAARIYEHWRHNVRHASSNIVLLGREINSAKGTSFADLEPLILRAQGDALLGISRRLLLRAGYPSVVPPQSALTSWISTFGGDANDPNVSVDLIAFGAACERRLSHLADGDFHLEASDATDAVQSRYLDPLSPSEIGNLLRVAAFSQFEMALPAIALPNPLFGFPISQAMNGLVLQEEYGMDRRRVYRLSHPAIGALILRAATGVDSQKERLSGAIGDPATGLQLLYWLPSGREREEILKLLRSTLNSLEWLGNYQSIQPVVGIIKGGFRHGLLDSSFSDRLASSSKLQEVYVAERSVFFLNEFHFLIERLGYQRVRETVRAITEQNHRVVVEKVTRSTISDVELFGRTHPAGYGFLRHISDEAWAETQSFLKQPPPSHVLNAARRLEEQGLKNFGPPAAATLILRPNASEWESRHGPSDFSHLSHLLRIGSEVSLEGKRKFLEIFRSTSWLDKQYERTKPGILAASLMSLTNYLNEELWHLLYRDSLAIRVRSQLSSIDGSQKRLIRSLALLGAATAARHPLDLTDIRWPSEASVASAIDQRALTGNRPILGMYELQLWSGVMAMTLYRDGNFRAPSPAASSFLRRLIESQPPTDQAKGYRERMVRWLIASERDGWILSKSFHDAKAKITT